MPRIPTIKIVFILMLCSQGLVAFAQSDSACGDTDDKKAKDLYAKGTDKKKYQKPDRENYLNQAIKLEPDYAAANFAMAEELVKTAYADNTSFDPATPYFMAVINNCPHYHSDPYYFVALSYFEANKYADAMKYFQKFIDFKDDDMKKFSKDYDSFIYDAKQKMKTAKFYGDLFTNKVPFDPHMVAGLCTNYDEYLAIISPDNQLAFFTRKMPMQRDINSSYQREDNIKEYFMISHRQADGTFETGKPMPPPFNRGLNEGGPSITIDNKHLYFTVCKDDGEGGSGCRIYTSDFVGGKWGDIKSMGERVNDPSAWNSQPSISSDGQTLYFASNRPGGMGKCDLYESEKDSTGTWMQAKNLGPGINTPGNEKSPFIHTDSHTLYFSSDGWPGAGGFDIFYSRMDSSGK